MDTTNKKGSPRRGMLSKTQPAHSNSAHAQRRRLLERLKAAPIDTITARRELDIMHPAARIMELKRRGYRIDTVWVGRQTDGGAVHRVALYVLQQGHASDE